MWTKCNVYLFYNSVFHHCNVLEIVICNVFLIKKMCLYLYLFLKKISVVLVTITKTELNYKCIATTIAN